MSAPGAAPPAHPLLTRRGKLRRRRRVNLLVEAFSTVAALLAVAVLLIVVGSVFLKGVGALNLDFFTKSTVSFGPGGGIANAIVGTGIIVGIATVMAVPIGLLVAIYTSEFADGRIAHAIRFALDVLNGVPTILTGVFVYGLIVVGQGHQSGTAGAIALAIIMLPIVARTAQEVLALVPGTLKEGAYALGVTRWRTVLRVTLPTAAGGLLTGSLLAVARVAGETAPLILVCSIFLPGTVSTDPSQGLASIPVFIFQASESPSPESHTQAWAAALVLIAFVLVLNIIARAFYARSRKRLEDDPARIPRQLPSRSPTMNPAEKVSESPMTEPQRDPRAEPASSPRPTIAVTEGQAKATRGRTHRDVGTVRLEGLHAYYGSNHAVRGVDLVFDPNEVTAIIGPSGCGKSTMVRCINRMHEEIPSARAEGKVVLDQIDLYDSAIDVVAVRRSIGMVFQKPNPFPTMSIVDNVTAGLRLTGAPRNEMKERAQEALQSAGLWDEVKDRLNNAGGGLSGGQQQRLCIARALAVDPEVLLMDEPCSALDPQATLRIEELISQLRERVTIVIVTHNMQQAARVADTTAFMLNGEMVEVGQTEKMFTNPDDDRTEQYVTGKFG